MGPGSSPGQAIPGNFTRHHKGDLLIKQEMQKLCELHSAERAFLSPEGNVKLRDPVKGKNYTGLLWSQILARSPDYFSTKFKKIRSVTDYGLVVHAAFVKMTKSRQATWIVLTSSYFWYEMYQSVVDADAAKHMTLVTQTPKEFLQCLHEIPLFTVGTVAETVAKAKRVSCVILG